MKTKQAVLLGMYVAYLFGIILILNAQQDSPTDSSELLEKTTKVCKAHQEIKTPCKGKKG